MSRHRPSRPMVLGGALLAGLLAAAAPARAAAAPAAGPEAVRRAMLATYVHGVDDALARDVLAPQALAHLRSLLRDAAFPRRDNVVAFLGHLDRGAATADLLAFLSDPPADVTVPEEDRALLLAPQALGRIAGRGDRAALEALLHLTEPGRGGDPIDAAAARGPNPAALRTDLIEMSLRGLAYSRAPEARRRIADVAAGRVRFGGLVRDLAGPARESLILFDATAAGVHAAPAGRPVSGSPWSSAAAAPGPSSAGALTGGGGADLADTQSSVHESRLTFANHVAVTNPMTDARLDESLAAVNMLAGRAEFTGDVSCCVLASRSMSARTFGSATDGLDVIDNSTELNAVLNNSVARVKVVRGINFCSQPGTNIIGCAWVGGNGMSLVRLSTASTEGILWLHEFGHNTGLGHSSDSRFIMYGILHGGNNGMSQSECSSYHAPAPGAQITPDVVGTCSDDDADALHDYLDNCPGLYNFDQANADGDPEGDACDPDDDNDGVSDGSDCAPFGANVWSLPGEAKDLAVVHGAGGTVLSWSLPDQPGATPSAMRWDRLLATGPAGFTSGAACIPSGSDPSATTAVATVAPPAVTVEPNLANARFGSAVAFGDLDRDGFADLIVGAPLFLSSQEGTAGRAFWYRGSASGLSQLSTWSVEGVPFARLGTSLATGDVNGDTYPDLLVGAPRHGDGVELLGGAFLFLGGPSGPSMTADWGVQGEQHLSEFGESVALADVNDDGFLDAIVGAPGHDGASADEGRVSVFLGGPSGPSSTPAQSFLGGQAGALLGQSVAAAGDVNGDGFEDVIAGAPGYDDGQADEGRALVLRGSASGLAGAPLWMAHGDQDQAGFGASVSAAGDVDGDGYGDVVVGAPSYSDGVSAVGAVFLFRGSSGGPQAAAAWSRLGGQSLARFGAAVAGGGDVNGDGFPDVVVGSDGYDGGQADEGAAFVFLGDGATLDGGPSLTLESEQASAILGTAVAVGGDVNGDGRGDVAAGAEQFDNPQSNEGRAFLVPGSALLRPAAGEVFFYLIRAENLCGGGPLGFSSSGAPISGISCP